MKRSLFGLGMVLSEMDYPLAFIEELGNDPANHAAFAKAAKKLFNIELDIGGVVGSTFHYYLPIVNGATVTWQYDRPVDPMAVKASKIVYQMSKSKVETIRFLRSLINCGLKEAKEFVELCVMPDPTF